MTEVVLDAVTGASCDIFNTSFWFTSYYLHLRMCIIVVFYLLRVIKPSCQDTKRLHIPLFEQHWSPLLDKLSISSTELRDEKVIHN